jgi:hypothetical protein
MSNARAGTAGSTRVCPHCKTTILDSAAVCPSCKHHLRFEPSSARTLESSSALRVEGTIRHPPDGEPWEYSVVLTIRNDRGEEVARQVVGVGALRGNEQRTFTLDVEMFTPAGVKLPGGGIRH